MLVWIEQWPGHNPSCIGTYVQYATHVVHSSEELLRIKTGPAVNIVAFVGSERMAKAVEVVGKTEAAVVAVRTLAGPPGKT